MSFLKNAIRDGLRKGIGDAVGKAVKEAMEPVATKLANEAAEALDGAASRTQETVRQTQKTARQATGWESALGNLQRSMEGYATQAARNMKICPKCEAPAGADEAFCPQCGAKLPEQTLAQGAVCTACGKQNTVGTKFCSGCGAKLPAAIAEEQALAGRNAAVMQQWDEALAHFPKWNCGGTDFNIEYIDGGYVMFAVCFPGDPNAAYAAVKQYREVLMQNGFHQAGQYPSIEHLYNKVDGICCHVDTEHCFGGDPDCATLGFDHYEPTGGYDYVKPEPRKKVSLFDLLK